MGVGCHCLKGASQAIFDQAAPIRHEASIEGVRTSIAVVCVRAASTSFQREQQCELVFTDGKKVYSSELEASMKHPSRTYALGAKLHQLLFRCSKAVKKASSMQ